MRNNLVELIGTFFLVLAVGFTGDPLAIGLMLAVAIYTGGHISGAHYNPAVTLGFLARKDLTVSEAFAYIVSQLLGASLAAGVFFLVHGKTFAPAPGAGFGATPATCIELLGTFLLVLVIFNVARAKELKGNFVYGFAIGLTITAVAYSGGPVSGGAFNPAVALGPMLVDLVQGGSAIQNVLIYLV